MLNKALHIGKKDINAFIKSKSKLARGELVYLRFAPNNKEITRWAFVVSTSSKRSAVIRNLTRRRMNEIAGILGKNMQKGWDLVFFVKIKNRLAPSYSSLKEHMTLILKKVSLYV